jgi:N utilization substance protein A
MNSELIAVLDYLESERGIDRETLLTLVEESLISAARKAVGPANELRVHIDRKTGDIRALAQLEVVETVVQRESEISLEDAQVRIPDAELGQTVDWEVTPENFGRIAAQTARQVIAQRLRQAERQNICDEFRERIGQLITGVVQEIERRDIIIDFARAEGILRYAERIPGENYRPGDHITAVLLEVNADRPGPALVVSRAHPDLVRLLFEREVTEIGEGLVEMKAIAREAGYRTKIAVRSLQERVDPVGSCVGLRGNRVKTIVRELGGEKVDIIRWDENIKTFVSNALQPATLSSVVADEASHTVRVKAPDDQLSLAIGKKGQNARLAAKLTGWRIDIDRQDTPQVEGFEDKIQHAIDALAAIPGISAEMAPLLVSNGFLTVEGIVEAEASDLSAIEGIDPDQATEILAAASKHLNK